MPALLFVFSLFFLSSNAVATPLLLNALAPDMPIAASPGATWVSCFSPASRSKEHYTQWTWPERHAIMTLDTGTDSFLIASTPLVDVVKTRIVSGAAQPHDFIDVNGAGRRNAALMLASAGQRNGFLATMVTRRKALIPQSAIDWTSRLETGVTTGPQARRDALADRLEVMLLVLGTWLIVLLTWKWRRNQIARL